MILPNATTSRTSTALKRGGAKTPSGRVCHKQRWPQERRRLEGRRELVNGKPQQEVDALRLYLGRLLSVIALVFCVPVGMLFVSVATGAIGVVLGAVGYALGARHV